MFGMTVPHSYNNMKHSYMQQKDHISGHGMTLRLNQNGCHFGHNISKYIDFLTENVSILNEISLKFVPQGPIDNYKDQPQAIIWTNDDPAKLYKCITWAWRY